MEITDSGRWERNAGGRRIRLPFDGVVHRRRADHNACEGQQHDHPASRTGGLLVAAHKCRAERAIKSVIGRARLLPGGHRSAEALHKHRTLDV